MKQTITVSAWSPGHISGLFFPIISDDPQKTGSIGAGIAISQGVTVTITAAPETTIHAISRTNGGVIHEEWFSSSPLKDLLHRLEAPIPLAITTECTLPLSSGFGLSAASLLALVYAAREYFHLTLSDNECAQIAHEVEVLHRTGLGDIAGSMRGGIIYRSVPGIEGGISGHEITHSLQDQITALILGPLQSHTILTSDTALSRIKSAFPSQIPHNITEFFELSYLFAKQSGLITPAVAHILEAAEEAKVYASMTMLGEGVFALGKEGHAFLSVHAPDQKQIFPCNIACSGPRVLTSECDSIHEEILF